MMAKTQQQKKKLKSCESEINRSDNFFGDVRLDTLWIYTHTAGAIYMTAVAGSVWGHFIKQITSSRRRWADRFILRFPLETRPCAPPKTHVIITNDKIKNA
jgi:hypothetical protein